MTPPRHITSHAVERYRERVDPKADYRTAIVALSSPAIHAALNFGAEFVRLGTGQRIVLKDQAVVTVLPAEHRKRQIGRRGLGRYGRCPK